MYACAWDFLIMRTRLLIHYANGKTFTGEWDKSYDFSSLRKTAISSLQIQQDNGIYHTLSCNKKKINNFWQKDQREEGKLINRSIFKRLSKKVWLDLTVDCINYKRKITIIREDVEAPYAK